MLNVYGQEENGVEREINLLRLCTTLKLDLRKSADDYVKIENATREKVYLLTHEIRGWDKSNVINVKDEQYGN